MGSTTCSGLGFAVLQPWFRLGKQEKGNSFILQRASLTSRALTITAMMSPSFCFLPSITMYQHCLRNVGTRLLARLARLFSRPCALVCCLSVCSTCFSVLFKTQNVATIMDRQRGCVYKYVKVIDTSAHNRQSL